VICTADYTILVIKIKMNEMGRACGTYVGEERSRQGFGGEA
jgi:hypothetical protein